MCIDMGQADSSLYRKPAALQHKMCWTRALRKAATQMGYQHYMDVPDAKDEDLRALARDIQVQGGVASAH